MPRLKVAWDSDILISWFTNEKRQDAQEAASIAEAVRRVDSGEVVLILSGVVLTEVLTERMPQDKKAAFKAFLRRSNISVVDSTATIFSFAGRIRETMLALPTPCKLEVADSIHVATAALYRASALYSFDVRVLRTNSVWVDGIELRAVPPPPPAQLPLEF